MIITRVLFKKPVGSTIKSLAICDIVLGDCLRVADIRLFKNEDGYYLVFPSKQDVYQNISMLNPDLEIQYPTAVSGCSKGKYEEFYHPVSTEFYEKLLSVVVDGYKLYKKNGSWNYVPEFKS